MRRLFRALLAVIVGVAAVFVVTGIVHRPDPGPLRLRRETVTVDGTRLGYHRRGAGADVVLIHGGMGSAEDFEPVLDRLAAEFRVTAVDRPGFGLSYASGDDPTYAGNARLVAGLVQTLGIVRPVVVGHSYGGGVALALAEQYPTVPSALVLLAPAAYPSRDPEVVDRLGALPFFGEGAAAWLGPWVGPSSIRGVLEPMIAPDLARLPPDFVAYRQQLWTCPRSLAVRSRQTTAGNAGLARIASRLGTIRVPSLILACSSDVTEGHSVDSRRLARELPESLLRWLEGCGHFIQYARPDAVVEGVRLMAERGTRATATRPGSWQGCSPRAAPGAVACSLARAEAAPRTAFP
jgi:pimeloyl-ACP methyl ester carboxylesterase